MGFWMDLGMTGAPESHARRCGVFHAWIGEKLVAGSCMFCFTWARALISDDTNDHTGPGRRRLLKVG